MYSNINMYDVVLNQSSFCPGMPANNIVSKNS